MSRDLSGMLNRSVPFAPTDDAEISRRLERQGKKQAPIENVSQIDGADAFGAAEQEKSKDEISDSWDVFVPVREKPHETEGLVVVEYEVRETGEGGGAVPIYTTPEKLQRELGESQPLVKVDIIDLLQHVRGQVPVVVDPVLKKSLPGRKSDGR